MVSELPPLLIRADASTRMGSGHLMRCLALAQGWKERGGPVFFLSSCPRALRQRIESTGLTFLPLQEIHPDPHDLEQTLSHLEQIAARSSLVPWVVIDGYHFDATYYQAIRAKGYQVLVIDDTAHLPRYDAHIVLNQNLFADLRAYRCAPETLLLLGPRYVLLRPEFLAWQNRKRSFPQIARRVLVTLGGSDPDNVT
ncbi:MAG: UDP-2,4-diacetamido-2,4,6-trideoxy-beta-L-altropyranose hydrolase, partial [Nitrospinota bacterium]